MKAKSQNELDVFLDMGTGDENEGTTKLLWEALQKERMEAKEKQGKKDGEMAEDWWVPGWWVSAYFRYVCCWGFSAI